MAETALPSAWGPLLERAALPQLAPTDLDVIQSRLDVPILCDLGCGSPATHEDLGSELDRRVCETCAEERGLSDDARLPKYQTQEREDIATLLAEVRRLAPLPRVATWGGTSLLLNSKVIAFYAFYYKVNKGAIEEVWRALECVGPTARLGDFGSEIEARACIKAWAKAKGWEVRNG